MSQSDVIGILMRTLMLTVELSAPMLCIAVVVGVLVSIFQAVTQINDSTLSLVPKIISVFAALALFGPWMFQLMLRFTEQTFTHIPGVTP